MPHTSNRVEAAEGKARGIGPSGAEHCPAQGVTLGAQGVTLGFRGTKSPGGPGRRPASRATSFRSFDDSSRRSRAGGSPTAKPMSPRG